uniref:NADH dehydrogenase subunit 4 n=1 Tax=Sternochetus olivieri TaxID=2302647 RepID=UPI002238561D|nr:NADH dehydrogenase subunit 4 [Sternochetus olivieri]UYP50721.1 NADH dehydrogenase subunit 4 [Sternochetus olivieri]
MEFMMSLIFLMPLFFMKCYYWFFLMFLLFMSFKFMMKLGSFMFLCKISYFMGLDLLSFCLILLSFWICSLMILASEMLFKSNYYWKLFLFLVLMLMMSLLFTFSALNMFVFYLFFEISLIPVLLLIIGWGIQPERISAGIYLMFYTLLVSLPMMLGLFYIMNFFNTLEFYFFTNLNSFLLYMCTNMVFFVKIPMYSVHLWLPKAHVEAPISGSMILAGVMLKLGGYGLMRVMKMFIEIGLKINLTFIVISLFGGAIISLVCLRQSDMKLLIAYSSVSHMSLVLSGILTMNLWGMWGALGLMMAHGLCSSGLFCLANLSYERIHSRSIYLNKGLMNFFPNLSLWWFLLCSSNMAAPPSLNLMSEILLINSLFLYSKYLLFLLFFLCFYSAVYSLFLYSYTQHGKFYSGLYSFFQINLREYLLMFLHWVPLNLLILKSEFMVMWI